MKVNGIYIPFSELWLHPNWAPYFAITAIEWMWLGKRLVKDS